MYTHTIKVSIADNEKVSSGRSFDFNLEILLLLLPIDAAVLSIYITFWMLFVMCACFFRSFFFWNVVIKTKRIILNREWSNAVASKKLSIHQHQHHHHHLTWQSVCLCVIELDFHLISLNFFAPCHIEIFSNPFFLYSATNT